MSLVQTFLKELQQEATTTRKMLSLVPDEQFQWRPHQKSMSLQQLATHIAELPGWVALTLNTSELDFAANGYTPLNLSSRQAVLESFEKSLAEGKAALETAVEAQMNDPWTMRNGETVYSTSPKAEVIRMSLSQTIHHRAQLGVFLRLLDIPIPGSYGPSADDPSF